MIIIPAIDIKGGRCVRLQQGLMSKETVFSDFPEEMAQRWADKGAQRLHIVDLDGAVQGRPVNAETIARIVEAVRIPVELGGGIRDVATLKAYFDLGIAYAILGTVALKNPDFVKEACNVFPGKIILGIDARGNRVAAEGWTEEFAETPLELARKFEFFNLAAIIYTDIFRDGMRTGPNTEATRALARALDTPVIASGGIADIRHVEELLQTEKDGVIGMITGRALYDGTLDLEEAIRLSVKFSS